MSSYAAAPGTRVLAIDDDPGMLSLLRHMLGGAGYRVEIAAAGDEGLAKIRTRLPDLVVCDIQMPGKSGFDVLDTLRSDAATAALPFVLLTARGDREAVRRGMRLGADDFLSKPVRPLELVESISAALNKRQRPSGVPAVRRVAEAELAGMTGRKITQTVLFSDIRGFTSMSERLPVTEVAELLSHYLHDACQPILQERGRIMKIMGDGLMAVFGQDAPGDVAAHAAAGLRAAHRIIEVAQEFRHWITSHYDLPGLPPFDVGVGIHTGEVMLFRLSVAGSGDLTAVGDTVNVASRLEAKSKQLGWPVVASMQTIRHAGAGFIVAETRDIELAGRDARIAVGRLLRAGSQPAAAAPTLGPSIPGYRILSKIGEGGMSSVYLAEERARDRKAVLKVLKRCRGDDDALWRRFFQECAILSSIDHQHVVRIYDQGFGDELAYIAMEHLDGGSLRERIERGVSPRQALSLLSQAASGLAAIHRYGIVHRDIKPANLMLRATGTLVLTDFGVAKRLDVTAGQTLHGEVLGTPYYISPEQSQGGAVTAQTDLYSLGVIYYEMLTGRRPFAGETILEILAQHAAAPVPRLPAALADHQTLIDGMLAKRAADRFSDAAALLTEIDAVWVRQALRPR
jgi:class 3 adenylate cyclase/tRNA A-37 threonylcarbamoyl transferase component Bud32